MIADWIKLFPNGILSIVSDTFDLWKLITEYLPANKEAIMARDGKLVIRPDSGDPVDIICGKGTNNSNTVYGHNTWDKYKNQYSDQTDWNEQKEYCEYKGVIELLWDIFGGTVNEQGYKVLDPHIGAIYGDSITLERQIAIYQRLEAKGFAATNVVFGIGSYTYVYQTRDGCGWAAKGSWFEVEENFLATPESVEWGIRTKIYNIFKDPVTDDGQKRSLKGLLCVIGNETGFNNIQVVEECTPEQEHRGLLQVIYENGGFYNQTTLTEIRERVLNHK